MWGPFASMSGAEVALDLAGVVARFEERSGEAIADARAEAAATAQLVEDRVHYWVQEVGRREAALRACMSASTENGPPDCSAYAAALREAETMRDRAEAVLRQLGQATDAFETDAGTFTRELGGSCPGARAELHRLATVVGWYGG